MAPPPLLPLGRSLAVEPFAQRVTEWQSFFALAGGASATLIGLLFVALSLNSSALVNRARSGPASLAAQSFADLLYTIAIAFLMLIPRQSAHSLADGLLVIGTIGAVETARRLAGLLVERTRGRQLLAALRRYLIPLVAHGVLLYTGVDLYRHGDPAVLSNLVTVVLVLLLSAAASAWALLLHLGQPAP